MVRSTKVVCRIPTESNDTPAMGLGLEEHAYTYWQTTEQWYTTHIHKHAI